MCVSLYICCSGARKRLQFSAPVSAGTAPSLTPLQKTKRSLHNRYGVHVCVVCGGCGVMANLSTVVSAVSML